jgi:hypothetical protein
MIRRLLEQRAWVALLIAIGVGLAGIHAYPVDRSDVYLQITELRNPAVFLVLVYGYAALWFTTPFFAASMLGSLVTIVAYRRPFRAKQRELPPYLAPERRQEPMLVLGESHFETTNGRAPEPSWLSIPQRGLYTGVMIVGAVGTGKTSACMYPYTDQLLRWRADDPQRRIGGLVLEVKGDFCEQVRGILTRAGRASDYTEIRLGGDVCYNPLHNDLDPYAVAYAIAALINNLFGKSKEPFWQQAYVDLMRFVILLRRLTDGYTTFAEVYRYILNDSLIDGEISKLKATLKEPPEVIVVPLTNYELQDLPNSGWREWFPDGPDHMARQYTADLEAHLSEQQIPFQVRRAQGTAWLDRRHQLEAVDRWFTYGWKRLDNRLRSSITEGIVVFLSLFDEAPAVHRTFCPPRSAYTGPLKPGEPRPLLRLEELLESGHVLALNFPVGLNPALARAVGVMLKLDFQRAVLQRIPKISAHPERIWRDLLFVCDEYHAFATVGETDPTGDERTFALSRQAKLIPIVATQSVSSLRSALPGDESWRTLLQCFRTKLFLATSDEFTARAAADLCGRRDRLKAHYTLSEGGQGAHISLLTGRATAARNTVSASKSYAPHHEYIFSPRVFTELQNGQAIALPYDGLNPMRPQFCYLKPHYLDVQTSYFDHIARGQL